MKNFVMPNSSITSNQKSFTLPDNLNGRSIHHKIIPTVCNLKNMLDKLIEVNGDFIQLNHGKREAI